MQTIYSFRIYPSKEQEGLMNQTIERCRQLYNAALEQRQIGWKLRRKSLPTQFNKMNFTNSTYMNLTQKA